MDKAWPIKRRMTPECDAIAHVRKTFSIRKLRIRGLSHPSFEDFRILTLDVLECHTFKIAEIDLGERFQDSDIQSQCIGQHLTGFECPPQSAGIHSADLFLSQPRGGLSCLDDSFRRQWNIQPAAAT